MKKVKNKFLGALVSLAMCLAIIPSAPAEAITVNTESGTKTVSGEQIKGVENGYYYELWNQYDQGEATMTLGSGGAYSCEWNGIQNVLFRRGVDFDCTKTYKEIGNIEVNYEAEYNNPNENTYLCVYGWTKSPLIEYYIVDSWGSWRPPGNQAKYMGSIFVDGGTYDVYDNIRENAPSIEGNTTFHQFWSVRQTKRTSGTISVSQHFAAWEQMGLISGKLYEAALNVEGYQSNGTSHMLDSSTFISGNSYSFSALAMQNETDSENFLLTMQYSLDGEDNWDTIASATGAKGEWVQFSNPNYVIPEGASSCLIYVETEGTTTNFM